jgi:hypothetical protein
MPTHNSQMLLYAAMNTGELDLAQQYADASVHFPATYGPMNMADGEYPVCRHTGLSRRQASQNRQARAASCVGWAGEDLASNLGLLGQQ